MFSRGGYPMTLVMIAAALLIAAYLSYAIFRPDRF